MFFIFLVYGAALTLEMLGSFISVIGLSAKTSAIIVFLIISLDFSKVMIATVLYKKWRDIHLLLKLSLTPVLVFLILVTSSGTYAFLLQEFSKTTAGQEQLQTKITLMVQERDKLQTRKQQIDNQIAQLPPDSVVQRRRLTQLFAKESDDITQRLQVLDKQIPQDQLQHMDDSTHSGTLGNIASAYGTSPEKISRIVALFLVLVIDPLAIVLLTVANFLIEQRKKQQYQALTEPELIIGENLRWIDKLKGKASPVALARKTMLEKYEKEQLRLQEHNILNNVVESNWNNHKYKLTPQYIIQKAYLVETLHYKKTQSVFHIAQTELLKPFVAPQLDKSNSMLNIRLFLNNVQLYTPTQPQLLLNHQDKIENHLVLTEHNEPLLEKDTHPVKAQNFITKSDIINLPIINDKTIVLNNDIIQEAVPIVKNQTILGAHLFIKQIKKSLATDLSIEGYDSVQAFDIIKDTQLRDMVLHDTKPVTQKNHVIDNVKSNTKDITIKTDIIDDKTQDFSLLRKRTKPNQEFYSSSDSPKFIPSNAPDIPLLYEDEVVWHDEDTDSYVEPQTIIHGFSTKEQLALVEFEE